MNYETPVVKLVLVKVEKGFAGSNAYASDSVNEKW